MINSNAGSWFTPGMMAIGAPELLILLVLVGIGAAVAFGLYALIRKAVRDGRRDSMPPQPDRPGDGPL